MKQPPPPSDVRVERMGAEGDGVAHLPDGTPLYIPLTLPDEVVQVRPDRPRGGGWHAVAEQILKESAARAAPPCGYFPRCGGCALQHWRPGDYQAWKAGLLAHALRQAGFTPPEPAPFHAGALNERRRMDFAVRRAGGRLILGLHGAHSAEVIDLQDCPILHPRLSSLLPRLHDCLAGLSAVRREGSVVVNLLSSGPDLLLRTDAPLSAGDRSRLAAFAAAEGLPRVSAALKFGPPETVASLRPAETAMAGVPVAMPPGAFMQATAAGEAAITQAVLDGLPKLSGRARLAELYAGCGTLTFALARAARVTAFEGDEAAIAALRQAANRHGLAGRVEPVRRDLARQPLAAKELAGFAAVILDPPHAGAARQIGEIAASRVPAVIYVSCNPATLGRDARVLREAGYGLGFAAAIDQFLFSPRLEAVCIFRR